MSDKMTDILEFSKELNNAGILSDDKYAKINARAKACKITAQIQPLRPMSGEEIRTMRSHYGMSQTMLAATLGITTASVSKWERDVVQPSGPALRLLNTLQMKGPDIFIA
ncbi:TPA: helix-turn-helix domain-containing protein [Pluralibacter gergoviae]